MLNRIYKSILICIGFFILISCSNKNEIIQTEKQQNNPAVRFDIYNLYYLNKISNLLKIYPCSENSPNDLIPNNFSATLIDPDKYDNISDIFFYVSYIYEQKILLPKETKTKMINFIKTLQGDEGYYYLSKKQMNEADINLHVTYLSTYYAVSSLNYLDDLTIKNDKNLLQWLENKLEYFKENVTLDSVGYYISVLKTKK
jgi:hypothetical protein